MIPSWSLLETYCTWGGGAGDKGANVPGLQAGRGCNITPHPWSHPLHRHSTPGAAFLFLYFFSEDFQRLKTITSGFCPKTRSDYFQPPEGPRRLGEAKCDLPGFQNIPGGGSGCRVTPAGGGRTPGGVSLGIDPSRECYWKQILTSSFFIMLENS